jgi:hypothetical protein
LTYIKAEVLTSAFSCAPTRAAGAKFCLKFLFWQAPLVRTTCFKHNNYGAFVKSLTV